MASGKSIGTFGNSLWEPANEFLCGIRNSLGTVLLSDYIQLLCVSYQVLASSLVFNGAEVKPAGVKLQVPLVSHCLTLKQCCCEVRTTAFLLLSHSVSWSHEVVCALVAPDKPG